MTKFDIDLRHRIGDMVIEMIAARAVATDTAAKLADQISLVGARDAEIVALRAELAARDAEPSPQSPAPRRRKSKER